MAKQAQRRCDQLPVLHPDAAGIDVGASELFVAVSADRDPHPVRRFPTFTRDLHALADWLQQCGVCSVAMESTSVYWIDETDVEATRFEDLINRDTEISNLLRQSFPGRVINLSFDRLLLLEQLGLI